MQATGMEEMIFRQPQEHHVTDLEINGRLPDYVCGAYYLNGPAKFHHEPHPQRHWLDGDGMARRLRIKDGKAAYTGRFIKTRKYQEESEVGSALFRTFGTAFPGDMLRKGLTLESPANVSLYLHGQRLLAFGEQSLPIELDPLTLETRGEWNFSNAFSSIAPFSAHPKYDQAKQQMHTFGITYFAGRGKLAYYCFDNHYQLKVRGQSLLKEGNYIHDFALSPSFACFHLAPYQLDVHSFAKKGIPLFDALKWQEQGAFELRIFSRASGDQVAAIELDRKSFCLHSINAWEKDGQLVVDLVDTPEPFFDQYDARPLMFDSVKPCAAVRLIINTHDWSVCEKHVVESNMHYDFPSIAQSKEMKPYQCFWAAGMKAEPEPAPKFYNRLFRFDWTECNIVEIWQAEQGIFLGGEPQMVEHPTDAAQGVVISQYCDPQNHCSGYLFFDAYNLQQGPIARLDLPFFDPPGFHTSWVSE